MLGGRIGDIFGQEIVLKVAMIAFNIFTLICALVSNKIGFLFGRALQGKRTLLIVDSSQIVELFLTCSCTGVAAALTIPSAQAMVGHLFPTPKSHALALSWWGASGSLGFV